MASERCVTSPPRCAWAVAALSHPVPELPFGGCSRGLYEGLEGTGWGAGLGAQPGLFAEGKL